MREDGTYSTFVAKTALFYPKISSKKPSIFFKLRICDIWHLDITTKMSFIAFIVKTLLSFIAQLSLFLRKTLNSHLGLYCYYYYFILWRKKLPASSSEHIVFLTLEFPKHPIFFTSHYPKWKRSCSTMYMFF